MITIASHRIMWSIIGRLTVIGLSKRTVLGQRVWLCACACGVLVEVPTGALTAPSWSPGAVRSCGCAWGRHRRLSPTSCQVCKRRGGRSHAAQTAILSPTGRILPACLPSALAWRAARVLP